MKQRKNSVGTYFLVASTKNFYHRRWVSHNTPASVRRWSIIRVRPSERTRRRERVLCRQTASKGDLESRALPSLLFLSQWYIIYFISTGPGSIRFSLSFSVSPSFSISLLRRSRERFRSVTLLDTDILSYPVRLATAARRDYVCPVFACTMTLESSDKGCMHTKDEWKQCDYEEREREGDRREALADGATAKSRRSADCGQLVPGVTPMCMPSRTSESLKANSRERDRRREEDDRTGQAVCGKFLRTVITHIVAAAAVGKRRVCL